MPKISVLIRFYDDPSASITFPGLDPVINKISDIHNLIELKLGIPISLQKLEYLDSSSLVPNYNLEYYSIANRARLRLTLISELDWKSIILAARKSDFKVLKDHGIISNRVLAVNSFMKSETAIGLRKTVVKSKKVQKPKSRKTLGKFKLADNCHDQLLISRRSATSVDSDTKTTDLKTADSKKSVSKNSLSNDLTSLSISDYQNLTPLKRFDLSVERAKIVEKSFDRTQEQVQGDTTRNRGIYTFWRALHSDKSIETVQKSDKESWSKYRKYICALSALSCQNFTLLKIIHDENLDIFKSQRTKRSNRSVVHIASAMGNLQGLKMILYEFKNVYDIIHEKDCKGLTASGLAKSVGQKHCGQILLYYDWQKRNDIKERHDYNFVERSCGKAVKNREGLNI